VASYIRYEIYIPNRYEDTSGKRISIEVSQISDFLDSIVEKYNGFTQSNPLAAPPFRGLWKGALDEIHFVMVLVPSDFLDVSLAEFRDWKEKLESRLNQKFILVMYSHIQIIGDPWSFPSA